jgi:hypothetical protein
MEKAQPSVADIRKIVEILKTSPTFSLTQPIRNPELLKEIKVEQAYRLTPFGLIKV